MKTRVARIGSKGQVTIPADVRRHLGVGTSDNVTFVVTDEGRVELRPARFPLESVIGSLPALPGESVALDEEIAEAVEEQAAERMRRLTRK